LQVLITNNNMIGNALDPANAGQVGNASRAHAY
jgi:hypothetical protein